MQRSGEAWGSGKDPEARRRALVADVVTSPVQVPVIATAVVGMSLGQLLEGKDNARVAGVERIRLRAVDHDGKPLAGARVTIGANHGSNNAHVLEAPSGVDGYFQEVIPVAWMLGADLRATAEGCYETWLPYAATLIPQHESQPKEIGVDVVLKRIRNPVPMYAKRVSAEIPESGRDIGYDFAVGDWVVPYGKGKFADMVLRSEGTVRSHRDYDGKLTVTFPGDGNGLIAMEIPKNQTSSLRMPYEAPEAGYVPTMTWRSVHKYNPQTMRDDEFIDDSSETRNFFIRVRTKVDAAGRVVSAWHGKIHAPFVFFARGLDPLGRTKRQLVGFTYYLNPDGTRNIEYDPKRNLLKPPKLGDPAYENLAP